MAYHTNLDFTDGNVLTAAQLDKIVENTEDNRDRLVDPGKGYWSSSTTITAQSTSYQSTAPISITRTFHGRPVLILLGGEFECKYWTNGTWNGHIAYKIGTGSTITALRVPAGSGNTWQGFFSPMIFISSISGSKTIYFYTKSASSNLAFYWTNPSVLIMELPFANMN